MAFPIKVCAICSEEFELKPGKPGYANQCPSCSASGDAEPTGRNDGADKELDVARRDAIRELLYRKDR